MNYENLINMFRNADNPVLYLGAGISRSEPSSIPLFSELMRAYINAMDPYDANILKKHAKTDTDEILKTICELPIEAFFADLIQLFHDKILKPFEWMDERPLNQAHKHIKSLVSELNIRTILTPNFDLLLEKTLHDYLSITEMKSFSKPSDNTNSKEIPDYLDISKPAIFHLHGTLIKSRIDITPRSTATPFDHFDHANLAERLGGGTVLFAGCSGNWDDDVIDLLKRCNLKSAIWVSYAQEHDIQHFKFPEKWKNVFQDRTYAIRGNTTRILSDFSEQEYVDQKDDKGISEFNEYLRAYFDIFDKKWRIFGIANFMNQIQRGDIALSIINDLENEYDCEEIVEEENEDEKKFLTIVSKCDSLTLRDGRELTPEEYKIEYAKIKEIYNKFKVRNWPIALGRLKTIAMSRDRRSEINYELIINVFKNKVINTLEEIIPYDNIGPKEIENYDWLIRDWMLAYESLGIFYLEYDKGDLAVENINKAIRICSKTEDLYRLEKTKLIAGNIIKLSSFLNQDELNMAQEISSGHLHKSKNKNAKDFMIIADKCYYKGLQKKAKEIYEAITNIFPDDMEACLNCSNLLKAFGHRKNALKELDRGLKNEPDNFKLLCNKGLLLNEMGKQKEAIPILKKALNNNPMDEYSWNNLGNSYYEIGNLKEALKKYNKAVELDPNYIVAVENKLKTENRLKILNKFKR